MAQLVKFECINLSSSKLYTWHTYMYVYNVFTYKCIFLIIDFIRIRYTSSNIRKLYQIKWKLKKFHQNSQIAVDSFEICVVWLKSFTYNWWCHLWWLASIKCMLFNDTYAYRTVCLRQLTHKIYLLSYYCLKRLTLLIHSCIFRNWPRNHLPQSFNSSANLPMFRIIINQFHFIM